MYNTYHRGLMSILLLLACVFVIASCNLDRQDLPSELSLGMWKGIGEMQDGKIWIDSGALDEGSKALLLSNDGTFYWYLGKYKMYRSANEAPIFKYYRSGRLSWIGDTIVMHPYGWTDADTLVVKMRAPDTLVMGEVNGKALTVFRRVSPPTTTDMEFDAVALAATGCYGYCPIEAVVFRKNGTFEYTGERNASIKGTVTGRLPDYEWKLVERLFREARIDTV